MGKNVRQRKSRYPVEKRSPSGELVFSYKNMRQARLNEHIGYGKLKSAIKNGTLINGHRFYFAQPVKEKEYKTKNGSTWEGEDGLFNVDAWAKLYK